MSDQTNTITEELIFRDAAAVQAMGRVASKVGTVTKAAGLLKTSLAAAFSTHLTFAAVSNVQASIAGISSLYEKVSRLKAVAGVTAATGHQLLDAFEMTGGEEVAERTIVKLTRLGQKTQGAGKEAAKLRAQLAGVGVNLDKGPTTALLSMSAAARAGRLNVNSLATTFKIPVAQAAVLMRTLQTGPERLREIMRDTAEGADLVDDAALASFETMRRSKLELADAWDGLVGTLYKLLLPGAVRLVNGMTTGFQKLQPVVEAVGGFLSKHMDAVVASAKAYLAYMVAAKAVEAGTGGKHSVLDLVKAYGKGGRGGLMRLLRGEAGDVAGAVAKKAAVSPPAAAVAGNVIQQLRAKDLAAKLAAATRLTTPKWSRQAFAASSAQRAMALISPGKAPAVVGLVERLLPGLIRFMPVLRMVGMVVARFAIVGAVLAYAVKAFQMISSDVGGYRTRITALLKSIGDKLAPLFSALSPILDKLASLFGKSMEMNIRLILYMIEQTLKVWDRVLGGLKWIGEKMDAGGWGGTALKAGFGPLGSWVAESMARNHRLGEVLSPDKPGGDGTGKGKKDEPPPVYDFRGSNITIQNKFAEGFDIGRVSVAITDGIAAHSQRRVQAGFAPPTAIRGRG